ncbi:MAG: hypothetical protein HYY20_05375 [Candidatus Tectomicrobia bacterium]|uniref:Uncharacterized protein n=1 Tax=Tectimicrobiota bacterium TaxID=2528274 RepID=A0A932CND0_UNCTE|nr:hypothetical protein [Candidatus Tectomicrobia bacterium]
MGAIVIDLPSETHKRLEEQARRAGKAPEVFSRELLETALQVCEEARPKTTREVLQAAGRVRPLSTTLQGKIIPGVSLDEVRIALNQSAGLPLSEIILEQRGSKP